MLIKEKRFNLLTEKKNAIKYEGQIKSHFIEQTKIAPP